MRLSLFPLVVISLAVAIFVFPTPLDAAGIIIIDDEDDILGTEDEWEEQILELIEKLAEVVDDDEDALFIDNPTSEEAKLIVTKLENQKVTFNFKDTPIEEVVDFIRDITGINIVISNEAMEIFDELGRGISLRLKDIRFKNALNLVLSGTDIGYAVKDGVLYLDLKEKLRTKRLYLAFYEISELVTKPPDFPAPHVALRDEGGTQIR
ncbi:MAG: hypothetical protein ACYS8W_16600 [Planctomycetota bacterium]